MSEPTLRINSLGAGWQSTAAQLMAIEGMLPRLDCAIFADTQWEPAGVYRHLDRLTAVSADAGIPVLRVSKGNLRADALDLSHRFASIPYYTQAPPAPCDRCGATGTFEGGKCTKCRGSGAWDGKGMGRRQCTSEYKLAEIYRKVRELLGAKPPGYQRVPKGRAAEVWVGFTTDEIGRVNDRSPGYIRLRYPLMELNMTRPDCRRWLVSRGWKDVGKSSCTGCPYLTNEEWREMRGSRPGEWADACAFDAAIRYGGANPLPPGTTAYLHASRVPLAEAPIDHITRREWKGRQVDLLDVLADEAAERPGCSPFGCRSGLPIEAGAA